MVANPYNKRTLFAILQRSFILAPAAHLDMHL